MKKILLLGSQHGDELLGEKLYNFIKINHTKLLENIYYKIGNLKAKKQKTRFTESDLNRSYNCGSKTYEQRRSKAIMKYITTNQFDLVIDLHTTTCDQEPCMIIPSINSDIKDIIDASFIEHIILMKNDVINQSLIGSYSKSISIEISKDQIDDSMLEKLVDDIKRFLDNEKNPRNATVYHVHEFINKNEISEQDAAKMKNFQMSLYGFYPILIGERTYKEQTSYLGFKANKITKY